MEPGAHGRRAARALAALAALALWPLVVPGAEDDGKDVQLTAAVSMVREQNIFRVPREAGTDDDVIRAASAAISFSYPLSAQRLVGEARVARSDYKDFDELNHTSWGVRGAWLWALGSRFDGQVSIAADSVLASLANLSAGTQSTAPNQLRIQRLDADAGYTMASGWELRGALNRTEHHNDADEFRTSDMNRDEARLMLRLTRASGSRVGLAGSYADATLPNPQLLGLLTRVDNSFTQRRYGAFIEWVPTGKSRVDLRGGYVARKFRQFQDRNYSGWSGSFGYEWRASERTHVTALVRRDISDDEQVNVGYVIVRGAALRPGMRLSDKAHLDLSFEINERSFRGDLALGLPAQGARRREVIGVLGADLDFEVTSIFALRLFGRYETRRANSDFPDYRANLAGLEVRATF